ncbi:MAG: BlaI/MecI/CopY family transcriptional regulator [Cyanobacteria bacterium P01_H01_bin.15]
MSPLPSSRPGQLQLGPLETEILKILWGLGQGTAVHIHAQILSDPERELAYASVMTVLKRLEKKGWVKGEREKRRIVWQPTVSPQEAQICRAHDQLHKFLAVGNPDVVAAFADSLDNASVERLEAIAERLKEMRESQEGS